VSTIDRAPKQREEDAEMMMSLSLEEINARVAELEAERVLVETNDGTHGLPADMYTWKRYATVVRGEYVDNPRALARDKGNTRVFPEAWKRVRRLRAEYRELVRERDRRAARERRYS